MSEALKPSGLYTVAGDLVKVTLLLICNGSPVSTLAIEGNKNNKCALIRKIVEVIKVNSENTCKAKA